MGKCEKILGNSVLDGFNKSDTVAYLNFDSAVEKTNVISTTFTANLD